VSGGFDVGGKLSVLFGRHDGIKCYAVVSGQIWLAVEGVAEPVRLKTGDCFLLPRGWPFRLATDLTAPPIEALTILATGCSIGGVVTVNGGGDCLVVGGHFALSGDHAGMLLGVSPPIVHIRKESDKAAMRWSLERMRQELREGQPGGFLMAQHLAHPMLLQALRLHLAEGSAGGVGWLFAWLTGIWARRSPPFTTLRRIAGHCRHSRSAPACRDRPSPSVLRRRSETRRWNILRAGA
jgi:hypothetical protein